MGLKDILSGRKGPKNVIHDIPDFHPQYRDPEVSKAHRLIGIRRAIAQVDHASLPPELEQEARDALQERQDIAQHLPEVQLELPADNDNSQIVPPDDEPGA